MSNLQTWRVCVECGREFFGFNSSKFCPICKADRTKETPPELADEKDSWRHMFRDRTGTVIVPGGNVIKALDDLCAYEEACEASGLRGPEELRKALEAMRQQDRDTTSSGPSGHLPLKGKALNGGTGDPSPTGEGGQIARATNGGTGDADCHGLRPRNDNGGTGWYDPHAKRDRRTQGKHCEGCSHYHPTIASGARGICDKHPRRVRPEGGKRGKYVVLDEPRQCQARRVACSDWEAKQTGGPRDPAPTRDGGADCRGKRGGQGSGRPTPRNDSEGDGGQGSGRPTGETPPEWVGPSAELKQKEGS